MPIYEDYQQTILETYAPPPVVFVRGEGSLVFDEGGKDYIDFGGGIAVLSLGHCPPVLTQALGEQAKTLMHLSNLHINAPAVQLAKRLCGATFAKRVFLCNSGAEANEAALKLARKRGVGIDAEKYHTLSFADSFHGRLGLAMAATGQGKIRDGFGPLAPGFRTAAFNDPATAAAQMDERVCAIIIEPIQGEGGINGATPEFLDALQELALRHDALLIFDEIQSGAGRTGTLYSYMQSAVVPDILTSAKGLGGGFPVAAMLVGARAQDVFSVGAHGTTYGGNALAAAAANAVLAEILADGFLARVAEKGTKLASQIEKINATAQCFSAIRQYGLLLGIDVRAPHQAKEIARCALDNGLVVLTAGTNTLRLAPALNIPDELIDDGIVRLQKTLAEFK